MTPSLALPAADTRLAFVWRRRRVRLVLAALAATLLACATIALSTGAVKIGPAEVWRALGRLAVGADAGRDGVLLLHVRLPRVVLGMMVGAMLAVAGALMQGLFRNPLADPGLVGVSSGAALVAAVTIVLGDRLIGGVVPFWLLPIAAFAGGLVFTLLLYAIATRHGRTAIATMLLAGVALAALAGAGSGMLTFLSDDRQLRDLTFWTLGSLGGAGWGKVASLAPILGLVLLAVPLLARGLNALLLGEAEAFHLGLPVQRIKALAITVTALAVGGCVAASGVIGFVGIVVPHLIRLWCGPDHRALLPASALLGAALVVVADTLARTLAAPAELPIGILTAVLGAPFFLWLLLVRLRDVA